MSKTKKNKKRSFETNDYYINRELSWIAFNQRVLELAQRKSIPLLERLKFLAIFSSNLDEFFMIRVAGLNQQIDANIRKKAIAGRTPLQQLKAISERVHALMDRHTNLVKEVLSELRTHGLYVLRRNAWNEKHRSYLKDYFLNEILPVLTPLSVQRHDPCPLLPGLQINVALTLRANNNTPEEDRLLVIPVPGLFTRFLTFPSREGTYLVTIEDIIADNASAVAPGCSIQSIDFFPPYARCRCGRSGR